MSAGSASGSVEMGNKRHRDNFIKVYGILERFKKHIFIVIKFILEIGKKNLQKKAVCMYHVSITPLLVNMVNCYWASQFYHKPARSCFIFCKKNPVFMRFLAFCKRLIYR